MIEELINAFVLAGGGFIIIYACFVEIKHFVAF